MSSTRELRERRGAIVRQMVELCNSAKPADQLRWKELNAQQEALRIQIQGTETEALEREMRTLIRDPQRPNPSGPDPSFYSAGQDTRSLTPDEERRSTAEYRKAFFRYARTNDLTELRALGSVSPNDGYQLVPIGFQREIETKMKAVSQLRTKARLLVTATGNPLQWPRVDDLANSGRWLAESAAMQQADPSFDGVTLGSALASSDLVLVPVQLMQDAFTDMEGELASLFAARLGRVTNKTYTVGSTGAGDPFNGLITDLVAASGRNVAAVGSAGNTGGNETGATSIGTDDFSNLIAKVDPAYRLSKSCAFMANQSTFDAVRKLKDKYGRPIWEVSLAQGEPDKIFGYPYIFNQDLDGIAANKVSLVFGDFSKFVIRDVSGITMVRFTELYMSNHQVGFEAFLRTWGKLMQPAAFSYLVHPAS